MQTFDAATVLWIMGIMFTAMFAMIGLVISFFLRDNRIIAHGVSGLSKDFSGIKERMTAVETELRMKREITRITDR